MQRAIAGLVDAECLRSASPRLVVSTAARARAHAIAAPHDARLIVACCGARGEKRWPAASYDALARALTARDEVHVALVDDSGPEPSSLKVVDRPYGRIVRVRGALGSVVALLSAADLVIAGDTGLAHAASAAGVPVVRIFGPTTTALGFPPLGARDRVVEAPLACRPCSVHGTRPCWRGDRACLTSIDPRDVARVALESLEGAGT
jgi:ADP-heptose:LPS heptosyltransferase